MGKRAAGPPAEFVYRGFDHQRDSGGDWLICACSGQRYLRTRKGMAPGRDPDTDADCGDDWSSSESRSHRVDASSAEPARGTVAQARTERERKALRKATGCPGTDNAGSCRAGDVDASDGAPQRTATAMQDCANLLAIRTSDLLVCPVPCLCGREGARCSRLELRRCDRRP
jgi:hypothetical protein